MYLTEILFLWQTQIQIVKYGLNDKGIEKSYIDTLLIQTLWYEFSNNFDVIWAKFLSQKIYSLRPFLSDSYALDASLFTSIILTQKFSLWVQLLENKAINEYTQDRELHTNPNSANTSNKAMKNKAMTNKVNRANKVNKVNKVSKVSKVMF